MLIVHGSRDRIASPALARDVAERISRHAEVRFVLVEGAHHAMLRHHAEFSRPAADWAVQMLDTRAGDQMGNAVTVP